MDSNFIYNINPAERFVRLIFSITLAIIPLAIAAPVGDFVFLPLLALYPGLTAALGWDPLVAAFSQPVPDKTDDSGHGLHGPA